ncbi:MAG: hypothetical protein ABIQ32_04035 [Sphingomicrobium sp.]
MALPRPRDRDLVRLHWPVELRPASDALFNIDDAMADVALRARDPQLAAIKLAWWREQLQALDHALPPAEPRLQAAHRELLSRGISGAALSELEEGWLPLVQEEEPQSFIRAMAIRGPLLLRLAARIVDPTAEHDLTDAGCEFATADLARRGVFDLPPQRLSRPTTSYPRSIRPVTALWALARRDQRLGGPPFEPEGTPGRSWTLLKHRFTGR